MTDQAAASPADIEGQEDGQAEDGSQEGKKKTDRKKLILLIALPIVVLIAAAAGVYFSGLADHFLKGDSGAAKQEDTAPAKPAVFLDLPEILVNLNAAANRRSNFLKINISLEVESPADVLKLQALMPRIVDSFQVYLRELRVEDLRGSAGMYRLREDLLRRINEAARPVKINDVLFKEMLIQ
jgi:flagellar FliL protein